MKIKTLIFSILLIITGVSCRQKPVVSAEQPESAIQTVDFQKMIIARVYVKPGRESDFISAAQVMIENSNKEKGCMGYMLYQDPYEKTNLIFVERYKNQAAVDAHFATAYFKEFGTITADMTTKPAEIKILDIAGEK
jgi:quinol monooxygenase YgiN